MELPNSTIVPTLISRTMLRIIGSGSLDLTDPSIVVANVGIIALASDVANAITLDAAAIDRLSPSGKTINVIIGPNDSIHVLNAADWRMTTPSVVDVRFVLSAQNQLAGGQTVHVDAARPYTNFLQTGDVNNNGVVSASDALAIIFELNQRLFSDASGNLVDPTQATFPFTDYLDVNGDGKATAADALNVINILFQQSLGGRSGSGEAEFELENILMDRIVLTTKSFTRYFDESLPPEFRCATTVKLQLPSRTIRTASSTAIETATSDRALVLSDADRAVDELFSDAKFLDDLKL